MNPVIVQLFKALREADGARFSNSHFGENTERCGRFSRAPERSRLTQRRKGAKKKRSYVAPLRLCVSHSFGCWMALFRQSSPAIMEHYAKPRIAGADCAPQAWPRSPSAAQAPMVAGAYPGGRRKQRRLSMGRRRICRPAQLLLCFKLTRGRPRKLRHAQQRLEKTPRRPARRPPTRKRATPNCPAPAPKPAHPAATPCPTNNNNGNNR